jgi:hypothetical protein
MSSGARVMFWTTIPAMVLSLRQMVEQAMRPLCGRLQCEV